MEQEPCQGQLDPKGNKRKKTKKVSCYRFFDTNPAVQRVTSRVHYVGLRNLGATCYMNCYLQTLFMNSDFRYRIFSLQDVSLSEMVK
jgi:ubiquitin C-terminal hydrolase